jgi:hypothetical protein
LQDKKYSRKPTTCWCKQTRDQLLLLLLLALYKRSFVVSNDKDGSSSAVVTAQPVYSLLHFAACGDAQLPAVAHSPDSCSSLHDLALSPNPKPPPTLHDFQCFLHPEASPWLKNAVAAAKPNLSKSSTKLLPVLDM